MIDNGNVHCWNCSEDLGTEPDDYSGDGYCADCRAERPDPRMDAAERFVKTWAGSGLASELIGDYDCTLTCEEADAMADLFAAFGHEQTARYIIEAHSAHDEPGDAHFIGPMEEGYYYPESLHRYAYDPTTGAPLGYRVNLRKAGRS